VFGVDCCRDVKEFKALQERTFYGGKRFVQYPHDPPLFGKRGDGYCLGANIIRVLLSPNRRIHVGDGKVTERR
jgi:hypothetical protein